MTAIVAPQLDGQFAAGVAFYTERLDSDAPYGDRAAADRTAQAEALRLVLREIPAALGAEPWAEFQAREAVALVARELGVEL